jgi:probable phosphoglycerate mutase
MSPSSLSTSATLPSREVAAPAPYFPATLWLVRHGESTWNKAGLAQGHNDEAELTERGLRQAADAAAQFGYRPVRAIYASDLRRAQQTAAAFAAVLGLPVQPDRRLRERSLGVHEGRSHSVVGPAVTGLANGLVIDPDTRPQDGESVRDLYLRVATFCDDLAASVGAEGLATTTGDVLVIAHGGTVRVLDAYIHGVPVDQMTWRPVDNATIVRIPEFGTQSRGGSR